MIAVPTNPLPFEPQQLDHLYKPFSMKSDTETAIYHHLSSSPRGAEMAHPIAVDIEKLNSPLTQNIMDMYHRSGSSWNKFTTSNALNNLGKQTAAVFNSYQNNFRRTIYSPLSSFLQQQYLLKGDPSILSKQILAVYNQLEDTRIPLKCCLQVNIRSQHSFKNGVASEVMPRFAAKEPKFTELSINNIKRRMKECIPKFTNSSPCYINCEILSDGKAFQIFEAVNKTVPDCSIQHPLCKIYNATQTILPNELDAKAPGLITVTFLADSDDIRVYIMQSDGVQLHGTRIFKDDLVNTIPKLFENQQIDSKIKSKLDELQFGDDQIYIDYIRYLGGFEKFSESLADKLPFFVEKFNVHNQHTLDLKELSRCFDRNHINIEYVKKHSLRDFRELLKIECGVSAGAAGKLWRYLGGHGDDNTSISNLMQHHDEDGKDYDPMEDIEFYQALSAMYPEYYQEDEMKEITDMILANESIAQIRDAVNPPLFDEWHNDRDSDYDYDIDALSVQSDWGASSARGLDDDHEQEENVNGIQYGLYNYQSQEASDDEYEDEQLSTPWSDDEDDDEDHGEEEAPQSCSDDTNDEWNDSNDDRDPPSEQAPYMDESLSFPSDWESESEHPEYQNNDDGDLELEYGASLSTPSEWRDEPDIDTFNDHQPYHTVNLKAPTFPDYDSFIYNSLRTHEAMANWLMIRYLLFYHRFLAEFYPLPKH